MPPRHVIPYIQARKLAKASAAPHGWREISGSFAGEVWPDFTPSFHIRPGQVIFTMGSCFARNIESHLAMLGCRVPMTDFDLPPSEWSGGVHGAMNRFHPPAFRQTLEWTAAIYDRDGVVRWEDCEPLAFPCADGAYFDLDMGATAPVARERFIERRQHVYDIFSQVFGASCLMMTPGLIEAWRDQRTGLYIHNTPKQRELLADPGRWALEMLSYETCHRDMLVAIDVVRARNPEARVLLTTSPVPLTSTFTGQDVRIANTHSKSILRAVCGSIPLERALVDYFPSYESVTLSFPRGVWKDDRLHVTHGFIAKIVTRMLDRYLEGVDEADLLAQRARMYLLSGEAQQCEDKARQAIMRDPHHLPARALLADALTRQGRWAEAEAQLLPLVEAHPERPELWLALARAVGKNSKAVDAIDYVEKAVALSGVSLLDLRTVMGLVRKQADAQRAEHIGRAIVELFPLHVESYDLLIASLIDQGRHEEAVELLRSAVKLRRTPASMYLQFAKLLGKMGQHAEALGYLRIAMQLDPENPKTKLMMNAFSRVQEGGATSDLVANVGAPV
ncbi:MAG TPA: GSCFA domain-containing protein [Caulobacteraceae bacterium]